MGCGHPSQASRRTPAAAVAADAERATAPAHLVQRRSQTCSVVPQQGQPELAVFAPIPSNRGERQARGEPRLPRCRPCGFGGRLADVFATPTGDFTTCFRHFVLARSGVVRGYRDAIFRAGLPRFWSCV